MKITFILKDLSEAFFIGHDKFILAFNELNDLEKFLFLIYKAGRKELNITMRIGSSNQFRDQVEFNLLKRKGLGLKEFAIEMRRGYRLVTAIVS